MLHRPRAALLAAFLSLLTAIPVAAQQFPQSLPANSVVCRLGVGPGPAQACSFERLRTALGFVTGVGTVTSVGCGAGLSGGTITGAGSCAVVFGTTAGTVMQGNDPRIVGALQNSNNLSDLGNAPVARTNLGLGSLAIQNAGGLNVTGVAQLTGLPACVNATDACPKSFIDGLAAGFHVIPGIASARLATAAVLPNSPTYSNGTAGVGATLTAGANTTLTVDGTVAALNDIILVNNQASALQNGIYTVTAAGDGSNPWVLTRHTSFDAPAEMTVGAVIAVTAGATNINKTFSLAATVTTVGTTAANFNVYLIAPVQQWTLIGSDAYRASGFVGVGTTTPATTLDIAGTLRATGLAVPASGTGVETTYTAGAGYIQSLDRNLSAYKPLHINAAPLVFNPDTGGTDITFGGFPAGIGNFDSSGKISSKPGYTTSIIYAADYGCLPANSAATNNTNCQAAIDAVTTNGGGILQLGAGNYNVSTTLTCNRQITIRGVGIASIGVGVGTADGTKITMAANADVFSCVTWDSVQFRDMAIRMPDGGTHAGISVTAPDLTITSSSRGVRIENVNFLAGGYGIYLKAAANFALTNNFMVNQSISGIVVDESVNTVTQDIGDATITGNVIWDLNATATGHGIHLNPSAIMVHNNKILGWTNSIYLNVAGLTGTLLISSNSLEEFRVNAFRVTHDGNASHVYGYINFSNNQVQVSAVGTYQGAVAIILGTVQYLKDIIIGNNIITLNGTSYVPAVGISIQDGRYVNVHDNILDMGNTASSIALNASGHATNVQFSNNQTRNYVTKYVFSVATLLRDLSGMTVGEAAGLVLANGSQVYFTDGNPGTKPCTGSSTGAMAFAQGGFKCLAN